MLKLVSFSLSVQVGKITMGFVNRPGRVAFRVTPARGRRSRLPGSLVTRSGA